MKSVKYLQYLFMWGGKTVPNAEQLKGKKKVFAGICFLHYCCSMQKMTNSISTTLKYRQLKGTEKEQAKKFKNLKRVAVEAVKSGIKHAAPDLLNEYDRMNSAPSYQLPTEQISQREENILKFHYQQCSVIADSNGVKIYTIEAKTNTIKSLICIPWWVLLAILLVIGVLITLDGIFLGFSVTLTFIGFLGLIFL